jgi:integrase
MWEYGDDFALSKPKRPFLASRYQRSGSGSRVSLTDRRIRGLQAPEKGELKLSDNGPGGRRGLYIVVKPDGRKLFRARLTVDRQTRYKDLGDYPKPLTLALARDAFDAHRRERRRRASTQSVEARTTTVSDLLKEWRRVYLERYRRRPEQAVAAMQRDVIPRIGDVLVGDVERRDLVLILDAVLDRGAKDKRAYQNGQRMAETLRSLLLQMFSFAVERGLIDDSPARLLPKPRRGRHGETRIRTLEDEELRRLWWALADTREEIPDDYVGCWLNRVRPYTKRCLKLLLLTGVRRSEAVLAEWSEIDLKRALWTIPGARTKTGAEHVVPLSDVAVSILEAQLTLTDGRAWVFASPRRDFEAPMLPSAVSQAVNDSVKHIAISKFTPHDLRRTVRSRLASLGVDVVVSRKILNHSLGGMDAVYDRHDYLEEKREALQSWADKLQRILAGDEPKVIPLRSAAHG